MNVIDPADVCIGTVYASAFKDAVEPDENHEARVLDATKHTNLFHAAILEFLHKCGPAGREWTCEVEAKLKPAVESEPARGFNTPASTIL